MTMYITRIPKPTNFTLRFFKSTNQCFLQNKLFCSSNSNINREKTATAEESLISIFTTRPFCRESPELQELSSVLTPKVVETVLKSFRSWRLSHLFFQWASDQRGYSHSCYVYNAMAAVLSTARQNAPLRELAVTLTKSSCYWTPGAFGYFLRCLGSQGLVEEANSLFDQMKMSGLCVLNGYSYNCLLEVIAKSGDIGLLECRLNEMRELGWPIDKHALTPALQCYCNAKQFDKAKMVFNDLADKGWVDQHILGILVLSYSKCREVDTAFELIEWAERNLKICLNEKTLCVLVHGFVREDRVDKALQLYDKMKRLGYLPDVSIYYVLIRGLCKTKEIEKALVLYKHMRESGIPPDVRIISQLLLCIPDERDMIQLLEDTLMDLDMGRRMFLFSSILTDLVNGGYAAKAYFLLKACGGSGTEGNSQEGMIFMMKVKPDTACFKTVIDGLCNADKLDMAIDLFHSMNQCGCKQSVLLFNNLIQCLSNADKLHEVDKALQLYDKMKRLGYLPDVSIYYVLIRGLCKTKEIEKALVLYKHMRESGIPPDVRIISQLLLCIPDERDMIQLLEDTLMDLDMGRRMFLFSSILTDLVNGGYAAKAYFLLKSCGGSGTEGNSQEGMIFMMKVKPDTACFKTVIDGLCNADKLDMAIDLFHSMNQCGCKQSVLLFNNLIQCLSNADKLHECFNLLNEMKETEFRPTHFTFNCILGCLCRQVDVAGALDLLREMRSCGHEPWIKHYTLLVKKLCEHGKADEAYNFLTDMSKEGFLPDMIAYSATIVGFLNINDLDRGMKLFREICDRGYCPDVVVLNIIIKGLSKAKRIGEAEDILSEILGKGLVPSVVTYNLLIDGWCKEGNTDQAILYFSRMIEQGEEPNIITYTTLVDGLCNSGKPDDALNLWIEMEQKGCCPNRISYMALIHGLCKCRKPDCALVYLQEMEKKDILPDPYVYQALEEAFASESNIAMAHKVLEKMFKHNSTS